MRRMWPRAQSKLYEEPKKLVAHGYARATDDSVGRRRRTRYTITAKGRRALAAWLQEPGDGPVLEFEQLLKISFADSGTRPTSSPTSKRLVRGCRAERGEPRHRLAPTSRAEGLFPERAALNQLGRPVPHRLLRHGRQLGGVGDGIVQDWPDDVRLAPLDHAAQQEAVRLAESVNVILGRSIST